MLLLGAATVHLVFSRTPKSTPTLPFKFKKLNNIFIHVEV